MTQERLRWLLPRLFAYALTLADTWFMARLTPLWLALLLITPTGILIGAGACWWDNHVECKRRLRELEQAHWQYIVMLEELRQERRERL
jgi:hypothetical protein